MKHSSHQTFDVCVVGSTNVDITNYVENMPKLGETIHSKRCVMSFGGKGANQCVMAAKLGANAIMITKLGSDIFGANCLENFKKVGVNTDSISQVSNSTGFASIYVDSEGRNSIVVASGANLDLSKEDVQKSQKILQQSKIVVCQLEIDKFVTLEALKVAKSVASFTLLNPSPISSPLESEFYAHVDILCLNEVEASILTGKSELNSDEEIQSAAQDLIYKGVDICILTLGSRGCLLAKKTEKNNDSNSIRFEWFSTEKIDCVDSCGAGDAFLGSLAYFLSQQNHHLKKTPEKDSDFFSSPQFSQTIQRACWIASFTCQKFGAQSSYPFRKELPETLFE